MTDNKKTILIVEDEDSLQTALLDKLNREGFETLAAKDGQEGLETALNEKPDLILLDIIMPKTDGMSMLSKLRQDDWGKNVPVIILTNLSDAASSEQAIQDGVKDYLIKSDWTLEDLVSKIKQKLSI